MEKVIRRTVQVVFFIFLLFFTHTIFMGGGTAGSGFADETGYYLFNHGHYKEVVAVHYYLNLVLERAAFVGAGITVILYLCYRGYLFYQRTWHKLETKPVRIWSERNGLLMAMRFPAYVKCLLGGTGSLKERYEKLLQEKNITNYELIDSGLAFYFICLWGVYMASFVV